MSTKRFLMLGISACSGEESSGRMTNLASSMRSWATRYICWSLARRFVKEDTKVQVPAAMALGTLAFQNDDNKNQIVECKALPTLVLMLRSEDITIHYVAVDVIRKLVNSSPNIKKEVLLARDLQPVLCLLSSRCSEIQTMAAFLLCQFATDSDCKVHVSQRGAIPLLVDLLKSPNALLQEVSTFALWRRQPVVVYTCVADEIQWLLTKDAIVVKVNYLHYFFSFCIPKGFDPDKEEEDMLSYGLTIMLNGQERLLKELDAAILEDCSCFSVRSISENVKKKEEAMDCFMAREDIVADIIKAGGFQTLKGEHFEDQPTKECAGIITLKRLEEKMQGQFYSSLAGLELLLDILESTSVKQKGNASAALHKLAAKASSSVSLFDAAPPSTSHQDISVGSVSLMYKMSEDFKDTSLKHACILFMLENFDKPRLEAWLDWFSLQNR
ncbi:hypothetical protein JHK87_017920 [Glycine soja]|nr:hypothetical protein JHK87_017920 [Glycine soja]